MAAEFGLRDIKDGGKGGIVAALNGTIVAALKDPLALLAERWPGSRGPGALHLTKSSAGPHERVLSQVRERHPVADSMPVVDIPVSSDNPAAIASIPGALPGDLPNGQDGGSPIPTFFNMPFGFPGIPATSGGSPGGTDTSSSNHGGTGTSLGGPGSIDPPPGNPGGTDTPPGGSGSIDPPPGNPGGTPGGTPPPTIAVPEPATWALMILGLLGVLVSARRRESKRTV